MSEEIVQSKPFYLSKTLWVNLFAIVAVVFAQSAPAMSDFIKANFAEVGGAWAVINTVLRLISKDQLYLS